MEKSANEDDHVYDLEGFKLVVAKEYDSYYKALEIDWIDNEKGKGFTIVDKARGGCDSGCSGC